MILDLALGKLVSWIRTRKNFLATAVVFICLGLAGYSYVNTPNEKAKGLEEPTRDNYLVGKKFQDKGNDKKAAHHFLGAMKSADRIEIQVNDVVEDQSEDSKLWSHPRSLVVDYMASAQYELGKMYEFGKMTPSDVDEEINGMNREVDSYLHKKEIEHPYPNPSNNDKRMYGLYALAAKNGSLEAQNRLGVFFREGSESVKARVKELGSSNPCEENTRNTASDGFEKKAFDWFQKAVKSNRKAVKPNLLAGRNLGLMYLYGLGNVGDWPSARTRCRMAFHYIGQAANVSDPSSLYLLGMMYEYGYGLRKNNYRKAFHYYRYAAELGDLKSQAFLAENYFFAAKKVRNFFREHPDFSEKIKALEKRMAEYANTAEANIVSFQSATWMKVVVERCDDIGGLSDDDKEFCKKNSETYESRMDHIADIEFGPDIVGADMMKAALKAPMGWQKKEELNTGSGFVVASDVDSPTSTYILTNAHVVTPGWNDGLPDWENLEGGQCSEVTILFEDSPFPLQADIVERSTHYDLALLKVTYDVERRSSAPFRSKNAPLVLGEKSYAFGYPHATLLSFEMHASEGNVSALAGLRSDPSTFETGAPLRRGNSGGPILDSKGQVIGAAVSIYATSMEEQNFNFAISHEIVHDFLEEHGITVTTDQKADSLEPEKIAEAADKFTVLVECWSGQDKSPS